LAEIGRKAEITVSDAEMTQAVLAAARQYPGQERQFFEFVQKNQQMQQQLRAPIFEDKVVDHIVALAKVSDKEISKDKLQKGRRGAGRNVRDRPGEGSGRAFGCGLSILRAADHQQPGADDHGDAQPAQRGRAGRPRTASPTARPRT
jgi:hypothetical protein